ncbi:rho GTPase-activating protein SYDE1 isoform X2 [Cuculus canorus]|uniref:rho GTPase-activating protein SYDE1 isoform X2 n=1 Tax=Cuculus canorus TaxID=55661 RepID=UPI0023AB2639|nr:rho GTPase-activating protein SYDE1 isoform X2 [Cuculus canorus]
MAEPLLRRTFSRLRGRGKKAGGKETGHHGDSPAVPLAVVPRKQNRTPFSCGSRDERSPKSSPHPSDTSEPDPARGTSQPAEEEEEEEDTEARNGSGELGGPGRSPRAGAYLQSLERSSRQWVLSAAMGHGLEEPNGRAEVDRGAVGGDGDIWYNPIPEDEGLQPGTSCETGDGGRRDADGGRAAEPEGSGAPALPSQAGGEGWHTVTGKSPPPPSPPGSPRKAQSLPKVKSPGTVRRLSLKMKKLPDLRRKLSLRNPRPRGPDGTTSPSESRKESTNVISRYHLDSSVASRPSRPKMTSKGAYLSDGDSPELPAKAGPRAGEAEDGDNGLDVGLFHPYSCGETPPRCRQHISGLVSVHLHGVRDLKAPRAETREVFCVLQVDAENRARTALLPCKTAFLGLNHTFNLELEGAQHLKVMVFSWDAISCRNRLCCHGTVVLPHIFRGCRAQQLAVRLQPRGVLYSKFTLVERWDNASEREPRVFGVELRQLVEREKTATKVPLLIQKCVAEIERRGLKVVGLYRLCGSAAVKKELRDAFERDSAAVTLSEQLYPDINVITGILKDFLRELPTPLITPTLYRVVSEAMAKRPPRAAPAERRAVALLDCLPDVEKNIAVCFGPVLLSAAPEPRSSEDVSGAVDFKRHLEVLHYLLQAWPAPPNSAPQPLCPPPRGPPLRLDLLGGPVVPRPRARGPESPPSNRYAGDWSVCHHHHHHHHHLLVVPGAAPGGAADGDTAGVAQPSPSPRTLLVADFALGEEPEVAFGPRLNLKDFEALIVDLEGELTKEINVCL